MDMRRSWNEAREKAPLPILDAGLICVAWAITGADKRDKRQFGTFAVWAGLRRLLAAFTKETCAGYAQAGEQSDVAGFGNGGGGEADSEADGICHSAVVSNRYWVGRSECAVEARRESIVNTVA